MFLLVSFVNFAVKENVFFTTRDTKTYMKNTK